MVSNGIAGFDRRRDPFPVAVARIGPYYVGVDPAEVRAYHIFGPRAVDGANVEWLGMWSAPD